MSIRLVTTCANREVVADNKEVGLGMTAAPRFDRELNPRAISARGVLGHRYHRSEERRDINLARLAAGKLGVEARGVGNVRDQPVEPPDIVLHDLDKAIARLVRANAREGLESTRSEVNGFFSS